MTVHYNCVTVITKEFYTIKKTCKDIKTEEIRKQGCDCTTHSNKTKPTTFIHKATYFVFYYLQ